MTQTKNTPGPITGPHHGPSITDQLRLIGALCGTDHPTGKAEQRAAIAYVSVVTAEMLEALRKEADAIKREADWLESQTRWDNRNVLELRLIESRMRGAIAKAEGRA